MLFLLYKRGGEAFKFQKTNFLILNNYIFLKAKRTQEGNEVTESSRFFSEGGLGNEGPGFILSPVIPQHMSGNTGHPLYPHTETTIMTYLTNLGTWAAECPPKIHAYLEP